MRIGIKFLLLGVICFCASCASYKQNIMFTVPEGDKVAAVNDQARNALNDYTVQKNDYLTIEVFSNNGEKVIDPNPELTNNGARLDNNQNTKPTYLVNTLGEIKLPMVGVVMIEGLTLREAESAIETKFQQFFKDPYININYSNKRVILLGASEGKVIPLDNPNMRLTEVLALGGGLDNNAIATNIRILRGDDVFISDLSTLEGYRKGDILIKPGDIIYIEPIRRPGSEALKDYGPIFSLMVSLASLIVIISIR